MKKDKNKKLNFSSLSVIELNIKQLVKVIGGADEHPPSFGNNCKTLIMTTTSDTCRTQTGPIDPYSTDCDI
jgi:hypothetical protein